jgi:epidermal growth factor receptor substrate 15
MTKEGEVLNRRLLASVAGALLLLLAVLTASATASDGIQVAGQSAENQQVAGAASGATQVQPSNTNISVRVLSPGDDGSVSQTNSATSDATASNTNAADQSTQQSQGGSGGIQTASQAAGNSQIAGSLSTASQYGAKNTNVPVRVLSPGTNGDVTQSNDVSSTATSTNDNTTDQDAHQDEGGSSCGCADAPGIQSSDQSARDGQAGAALSGAEQKTPENAADPTAVGSIGKSKGGSTSQSNSADSTATSTNGNSTDQDARQSQAGSGSGIQTSDQSAKNEQLGIAESSASQVRPTNTNISVRVLSPGNDGDVKQTNSVSSTASASNDNSTEQSSDQDPTRKGGSCGCGSDPLGIQVAKQHSSNEQGALALSTASQEGATNKNVPVRVLSPGKNGSVTQSNDVSSTADASNDNSTDQHVDQDQSSHGSCGCGSGEGIQVAEQSNWSKQGAGALSFAEQKGAKNENSPVRVLSYGNDGAVTQSNSVDSDATASNSNSTDQDASQNQSDRGSKECGCDGGLGIQVAGQKSGSEQGALAASGAVQDFGRSECGCQSGGNSNDPVRVWSPGYDGPVSQSNTADSSATADNSNSTDQDARQHQSVGSGIGIQALGQESENGQLAVALSGAFQVKPSNTNGPTRVYSPGGGGSVHQSNSAGSAASADNANDTDQHAHQSQYGSGGCGCSDGLGIQALGQSATSWQAAFGYSTVLQVAPRNGNGGAAVWSPSKGKSGSSTQSNDAGSTGLGENGSGADQSARQYQS